MPINGKVSSPRPIHFKFPNGAFMLANFSTGANNISDENSCPPFTERYFRITFSVPFPTWYILLPWYSALLKINVWCQKGPSKTHFPARDNGRGVTHVISLVERRNAKSHGPNSSWNQLIFALTHIFQNKSFILLLLGNWLGTSVVHTRIW